jgi:hypothetical protein
MPAIEDSSKNTAFSHRIVRTNDFKPTGTKTRALITLLGGILFVLGGLATAAIARGHGPLLQSFYSSFCAIFATRFPSALANCFSSSDSASSLRLHETCDAPYGVPPVVVVDIAGSDHGIPTYNMP